MTVTPHKVELIPFDPESEPHRQRLVDQRQACGWGWESVSTWTEMQREGTKMTFFVVLSTAFSEDERMKMLTKHIEKYPEEAFPLKDTAETLGEAFRTPTNRTFYPIGHIAYQNSPDATTRLGLSPTSDFWWITSLYISHAIQGGGLGFSSMVVIEEKLVELGAKSFLLDTSAKESTDEERWLRWRYDNRGHQRPQGKVIGNQEWYERQGYRRIGEHEKGYENIDTSTGESWWVVKCFLRKDI